MLEALQWSTKVQLEDRELRRVVLSLHEDGWTAAARASEDRFLELAGIARPDVSDSFRTPSLYAGFDGPVGDVFFREDGIYFALSAGTRSPRYERYDRPVVAPDLGMMIGLVTAEPDDVSARLGAFAEAIERACLRTLDGRKARHIKFEWAPLRADEDRIQLLCERLEAEGVGPTFRAAELAPAAVRGAYVLADPAMREFLRELSAAGFARETDILARRGRREDEVKKVLESLKAAALVTSEYLLQCRTSSAPLTRFPDPSRLEEPAIAELNCPNCNRKFSEELLSQGHLVSPLGRELTSGSHWMTVWVTDRLVRLGVPLEAITWNLAESTEEVDILVNFLDRLWIMELKDREFGPGDAHPFNYRRVRYHANEALVITTARVAPDAKRIFDDLSKESARTGRAGNATPVLIEGLEQVEPKLRERIVRASVLRASSNLQLASAASGFEIGLLLAQLYPNG